MSLEDNAWPVIETKHLFPPLEELFEDAYLADKLMAQISKKISAREKRIEELVTEVLYLNTEFCDAYAKSVLAIKKTRLRWLINEEQEWLEQDQILKIGKKAHEDRKKAERQQQ